MPTAKALLTSEKERVMSLKPRVEPQVDRNREEEAEPSEEEQNQGFESYVQFTRAVPPPEMIENRKMTALPNEMIEDLVSTFVHRQELFQDYVPETASIFVICDDKVRVLNLLYGALCNPVTKMQTGGVRQVFVVGKAKGKGKEKGDEGTEVATESSSPSSGDWIMTEEAETEKQPARTTN